MNVNDTGTFWAAGHEGVPLRDREVKLVRLVVIVAIAAIVASASYGAYENYDRRVNRTAVQQVMLEIRDRQQQYLRETRVYADDLGSSGLEMKIPAKVGQHYAITVVVTKGPSPAYVITATPSGNQANDGVLKLSSAGARWPTEKWRE